MRTWFDSLQQRERVVVIAGAVLVLLALLYVLAWAPLAAGRQALAEDVSRWEQSLADLRPLRGLQSSGATDAQSSNSAAQTPVVIVDQTLRVRGLDRALQRSQPTGSSGIRVEFENVAFDDLVLWLGDLSSDYGMQVTSGSVSQSPQSAPGRVNATFTLERG